MLPKSIIIFSAFLLLIGCATPKYSVSEVEFSYDKTNTGGSKYHTKRALKINHETGDTYLMRYNKANGYYWAPVKHKDEK